MDRKEYTFATPPNSPPLTADVYYASTQIASSPQPVAILFHPGGFVVGGKDLISKGVVECLVQELGIVAVVCNHRLCPAVSVWDGPVADGKACLNWVHGTLASQLASEVNVQIDVERIATIGFSAGGTIALLLVRFCHHVSVPVDTDNRATQAGEARKPRACLTFYGELYWSDPSWSQPKAALAGLPVIPKEKYNLVYDEGTVVAAPSTRGLNGPDLSKPRNAWLLTSIKEGWWLRDVVKDGDYARIDPANLFSANFPPTAFIHGTADVVCPHGMSERAYHTLKGYGVPSALFSVPDKGHDFDATMTRDDKDFTMVREALQWLGSQLGV